MKVEEGRVRALLVDDDEDFLVATSRALEHRGISVAVAASGPSALRLLERDHFETAVIDLRMPGMAGNELFKEIRHRRPETPIIILTGHGTAGQVGEFSRDGVFHYINKPCEVEYLAAIIRQAAAAGWRRWLRRLRRYQLGH